jgi:hypothetical protein
MRFVRSPVSALPLAFAVWSSLAVLTGCGSPAPSNDTDASSTGTSTTGDPVVPCSDDMPCPGEMVCLVEQCADAAPEVEIVTPEAEAKLQWSADAAVPVTVTVRATGLTLVDPTTDPNSKRGQGQIAVLLDGVEVALVSSGDAEAGVPVEVSAAAVAGAHRLRIEARLSDGTEYDNPGASARSLFWLDDGEPHVAFVTPVPGDTYSIRAQKVDVEVAAINFDFVPASAEAQAGDVGFAHVIEDVEFPDCAADPMCLAGYIVAVVPTTGPASSASGTMNISNSGVGKGYFVVHLVKSNHDLYCANGSDPCVPVWDRITVGRYDPDAGTGDSSGG